MAAPLSDCTIEEQRAIVSFLWAEKVNLRKSIAVCWHSMEPRTMHRRKIYQWIERFKEGRTSATDES
jgi:hypothetical protein